MIYVKLLLERQK